MKVIKRDGRKVDFDKSKIVNAIIKAMQDSTGVKQHIAESIASEIEEFAKTNNDDLKISQIETMVYEKLIAKKQKLVAKSYEGYRAIREFQRNNKNSTDEAIKELVAGENEYWNNENSNKNAELVTTQRDYIAGIVSTDGTKRFLLPPDIVQADEDGIIHFHDKDYFLQRSLHNCDLINLEDMLQNGTVINNVKIDKPHRLITATTIATQIITAVTSSQYGGATITLTHLAPFVRDSYNYYLNRYKERGLDETKCKEFAEQDLIKEVEDSVQTFNYQVNSMTTTNGQSPFLSVFMYLNEDGGKYKKEIAMLTKEFFKQRILGMKNPQGVYVTPAFPKLLYVLEADNSDEQGEYWWLTELAGKCSAKRLVPDYISEKKMFEYKIDKNGNGNCYPCMGCRSFLTPYVDENGKPKYYSRFNQGVVTLNLVDAALSSEGDEEKFWEIMDKRTELCHKALRIRHEKLKGTPSNVAPILWQYGALARLKKDEPIDKLLYGGYSTISLGYAGLYECVKYMTGMSHSGGKGKEFGLKVMQYLTDKCNQWKKAENIDYSPYGTPIESTTYKFAKCLQKRFGIIEGITDRDYITNSYHIPVFEKIDPFEKLSIESEFQKLSQGGMISYIETANLQDNVEAILEVIKYIYNNVMYAELNTKSDYCQVCGYDGEMLIDENMEWYCPKCGNRDHDKMNVARRTCGSTK